MKMFDKIVPYLRCCAGCGKSVGKTLWLCTYCELRFFNNIKPQCRLLGEGIVHYYLIDWGRGDRFLTRLVHSLKGAGLFETYTMLSLLMLAYFPTVQTRFIFYPSRGRPDHAFQLAQEVSKKYQCLFLPLYKNDEDKQALRSRENRGKLQFIQSDYREKSALLVDDIVTTGSTARACYRALNRPEKLTVWSLFYRKDL